MAESPEVKVRLTAEDTGVAAAIKELGSQLKNLKTQQDSTASSSINLSNAFKGLIAVIAVEKMLAFGKATADSAAAIERASQVTGASVQTLSVFHKTADDLGISTEAIDKGFVKLSRSILEFQQGSLQATKNFQQLGVSQKDLAGLNTDQKIKLITDKLGSMADTTTKAALAQTLMGRGGAELIPVLNELAGEGFEKARASAEKFGLLLDNETATSFLLAKDSLTDLEDVGKGVATQFSAGLAPAITDIANALVSATTTEGVSGFKTLGEVAGSAMKGILIGIVAVVAGIVEIGAKTSALIQNIGRATADTLTKGPKAAWQAFEANELGDAARIDAEIQSRETALLSELDGNTRQQEEAEEKAKAANRAHNVPKVVVTPAATRATDQAARAALSLLEKQLQDELDIHRAYAKQTEQAEKEMYDQGLLSLEEYFDRRRSAEKADVLAEVAILEQQRTAAQAAADKAGAELSKAPKKQKDAIEARQIGDLQKVEELNTKITEAQIAGATKVAALDNEQADKKRASEQETLAFERQIAELQGKRSATAKAEIDAEVAKRTLQVQQAGGSQQEVTARLAEIDTWRQLKLAVADYDTAKKKTEEDTKAFDIQKQAIEIKAKAGRITQVEEEREINQLIKDRVPLLKADAAAELAAAQKTGNQDNVADAQNTVHATQNLGVATDKLGTQVRGALTNDFQNFFDTVGRSTQTMAQQFEGLAASVVQSLQKIIVKKLMLKLLGGGSDSENDSGDGGGGGGGLLSFLHLAGGGLVKGSGGPKADAIPARLSAGEFVMKADAVSSFGAHNLEAINRGLQIPSLRNLALPKFSEGGLVGAGGTGPAGDLKLGIGLDEGLILKHLSSKDAGRVILQHLTNNPKAASHALSRSK